MGAEIHGRKEGTLMANYNAIYGNIYNLYRNDFVPKNNSRHDAHKKSELKNIYNNIVNISKEEPVFLLRPTTDIEQYTIAMKESAMQFRRDIASMGGMEGDKLFEQKTVYSSDPDVASAKYISGALINEETEPVTLSIEQLAKPQVNRGLFLPENALDIEEGAYSFDVSTPSSNYELQFNISSTDTNYTIQSRLSRLINNAAIGLNASITRDMSGNSALVITSDNTGPEDGGEPPFEISDEDTSQKSGIIDYLGIRNISEEASWAKYSINGEQHSSPENAVDIAGIYRVDLKNVTEPDQPITIATKADFESLKDHILGMAGSYNQFIRTASEFLNKHPRTTVLVDSMKRMENYYAGTMERLGIGRSEDGTLSVNEEALDSALKETATGDDISNLKDFTKSAMRKISKVQLNPMNYVDKRIVAYKNPLKSHFPNPYITSAYSGMLFNSYM